MEMNNFFTLVSNLWWKNIKFYSNVYSLLNNSLKITKKSKPTTSICKVTMKEVLFQ